MRKTAWTSENDELLGLKLKDINLIFLIIFCLEAFLKILCMGYNYFYDDYNKFDFFIVCLTLLSKIIEEIGFYSIGTEASILRIFRLFRILRVVARASYFRMIFTTFLITLPSLAYIGLLLLIILFIYSVFGMESFAYTQVQENGGLTIDSNFKNFEMAFLTLFRASTGEGWNGIMDDMYRI